MKNERQAHAEMACWADTHRVIPFPVSKHTHELERHFGDSQKPRIDWVWLAITVLCLSLICIGIAGMFGLWGYGR